jgi:hypothetical protein
MSESNQTDTAPTDSTVKTMEEMVRQTDLLKQQLNEATAAREAAEAAKEESSKAQLADQERDELAALRADKEAQLKKYHDENLPKAMEYIKFLEETEKTPVHEDDKKVFINAYTIPRDEFQRQANRFTNQMEQHNRQSVEMAASKKALEDKEAEIKKEKESFSAKEQKMTALMGQALPNMRASYAAASLNSASFQAPEEKETEERKESVGMMASRISAGQIMMPKPNEHELGFLSLYNYTSSIDMNASNNDPFSEPQKLFRTSMPAIRTHNQLTSPKGELNFPYSDRYHYPAKFSWLANESGLATADNLLDYVNMNAARDVNEPKTDERRSIL